MPAFSGLAAAAAVLSAVATTASAAAVSHCASDICYQVGVPSATASSGSGNIYFQISAPTSYQWVALGSGSQMRGANIFIMYQDGNGNVTVSPRSGTGHQEPEYDAATASQITLLEGSGVSGDKMVANVQCANCQSWSGGSLNVASSSSSWIGAWKQGDSLQSTSASQSISQHDDHAQFSLDLSQASIESDSNPFVGAAATAPAPSSGSSGSSGSSSSGSTSVRPSQTVIYAHGLGMAIVFAILYPLGSAVMPLFGKWYIHSAWQMLSWLLMWAFFGLGIYGARQRNMLFENTHVKLGTVVVCVLVIQPGLGFIHHSQFAKTGSRGMFSHAHIWWGRIWLILGVINGGLGLQLSGASNGLIIAYSVIAAIMYLVYAVVKSLVSFRSRGRRSNGSLEGRKVSGAGSGYAEHGEDVNLNNYPNHQYIQHGK
ncbi:hypothetical protein KVR01_004915 [Diaporthe batatas]|uniref:uncharacterized protein n=1 Tax=Diaporthe batatas TaxID=748121 RepID=UPI001D04AD16|nr:uncharacterized protein KVR01_004915 [Diaporthe batatas]KAG8164640.1 hypothetical protein KVR01_004915 [Diaporthe batatas]